MMGCSTTSAMQPLSVQLKYIRSTKGLCRYEEVDTKTLGAIYLSKGRLGDKPPKAITITIEEGSDATD